MNIPNYFWIFRIFRIFKLSNGTFKFEYPENFSRYLEFQDIQPLNILNIGQPALFTSLD